MRRGWIGVVVAVSLTGVAGAAGQEAETRAVMRKAYAALAQLLPAALAPEPMAETNRNGELSAAIETLAEAAAQSSRTHARPTPGSVFWVDPSRATRC